MASQTKAQPTFRPAWSSRWQQINDKVLALADAFPSERYNDRPDNNVRTFAGVLRHLTFWNQFVAESALGKNPNGAENEVSPERFADKQSILEALRKSATEAAEALEHGEAATKEEIFLDFLQHSAEHYGQLVVYSRLNGIVPPTSRSAK